MLAMCRCTSKQVNGWGCQAAARLLPVSGLNQYCTDWLMLGFPLDPLFLGSNIPTCPCQCLLSTPACCGLMVLWCINPGPGLLWLATATVSRIRTHSVPRLWLRSCEWDFPELRWNRWNRYWGLSDWIMDIDYKHSHANLFTETGGGGG